jgi:hypothetical protein
VSVTHRADGVYRASDAGSLFAFLTCKANEIAPTCACPQCDGQTSTVRNLEKTWR